MGRTEELALRETRVGGSSPLGEGRERWRVFPGPSVEADLYPKERAYIEVAALPRHGLPAHACVWLPRGV